MTSWLPNDSQRLKICDHESYISFVRGSTCSYHLNNLSIINKIRDSYFINFINNPNFAIYLKMSTRVPPIIFQLLKTFISSPTHRTMKEMNIELWMHMCFLNVLWSVPKSLKHARLCLKYLLILLITIFMTEVEWTQSDRFCLTWLR